MSAAPSAIRSEPPITWAYVARAPPCSSPNTSRPHTSPHSWFVFDSGIPRLMPTYLAAYCWNRSPPTHTTHDEAARQQPEQHARAPAHPGDERGAAAAVGERERRHHAELSGARD